VVGGNGSLTGYAGGLEKKVQLLQMERSLASPALEEMRKDSSSKQFVDDFPFVKYH
jgi:methylated-DNA-[protein]-cysteine S-methyltransferase